MKNDYKQSIADWFNQRTHYDDDFTRYRALRLLQLSPLPLSPSAQILDVATGTGIVAIALSQQLPPTCNIIGVDLSPGMLAQAQAKILAANISNIQLIEADIEQITFNSQHFESIYCSSALVLLADVPKALQTWYNWLKPQGFLAFTCYTPDSFFCPLITEICARQGFLLPNIHSQLGSPSLCQETLENIGFTSVEIHTEQLGKYMTVREAQQAWKGDWVYPSGDPLAHGTKSQKQDLIRQFQQEIAKKATLKGVWHEMTTFFVIAHR